MTHTAEPMTLAQVSALIERMKDQHTTTNTTCHVDQTQLDAVQKSIDAELVKQREAEPVAFSTIGPDGKNSFGDTWLSYKLFEICKDFAVLREGHRYVFAYNHPQQRNAVENDLVQRLRGRADYLRNLGRIKSPQLMESAATALSAVASRDREGAE